MNFKEWLIYYNYLIEHTATNNNNNNCEMFLKQEIFHHLTKLIKKDFKGTEKLLKFIENISILGYKHKQNKFIIYKTQYEEHMRNIINGILWIITKKYNKKIYDEIDESEKKVVHSSN